MEKQKAKEILYDNILEIIDLYGEQLDYSEILGILEIIKLEMYRELIKSVNEGEDGG